MEKSILTLMRENELKMKTEQKNVFLLLNYSNRKGNTYYDFVLRILPEGFASRFGC
jgi:hypothetical protein